MLLFNILRKIASLSNSTFSWRIINAMSFFFFDWGTWGVALIIILLDRWINFFKKTKPSFIDNIKYMHIIELFSYFINTSIDYHIVFLIKLGSMSTSCNWLIYIINFPPFSCSEIKYPCIRKLLVIVIFSTKYYHTLILIFITNYCRMPSSWTRWFYPLIFYFFPCTWFEIVSKNVICPKSKCKSSKNNHAIFKYQSCMFISSFRKIFIISI